MKVNSDILYAQKDGVEMGPDALHGDAMRSLAGNELVAGLRGWS